MISLSRLLDLTTTKEPKKIKKEFQQTRHEEILYSKAIQTANFHLRLLKLDIVVKESKREHSEELKPQILIRTLN